MFTNYERYQLQSNVADHILWLLDPDSDHCLFHWSTKHSTEPSVLPSYNGLLRHLWCLCVYIYACICSCLNHMFNTIKMYFGGKVFAEILPWMASFYTCSLSFHCFDNTANFHHLYWFSFCDFPSVSWNPIWW